MEADDLVRLKELLEAFNAHDLDRIMGFFADDCVLEAPRGPNPWGTRFEGRAAVREGLTARFRDCPMFTTATTSIGRATGTPSQDGYSPEQPPMVNR